MEEKKIISFSKEDTNMVKGIAILLLLFHHLFWYNIPIPVALKEVGVMGIAVSSAKVCVAIFTVLSGYGIYKSYSKKKVSTSAFTARHVLRLYQSYWLCFLVFGWIGIKMGHSIFAMYGTGTKGFGKFVLDFLGISNLFATPMLNMTYWYIGAIVICYILFPILYWVMDKWNTVVLILLFIPYLVTYIGVWENVNMDTAVFQLFIFAFGMTCAKYDILDVLKRYTREHKYLALVESLLLAVAALILRTQLGIMMDCLLGLAIIFCSITVDNLILVIKPVFITLGKYSMYMFMTHSFIYWYYLPLRQVFEGIQNKFLKYGLLLIICFIIAIIMDQLNKLLSRLLNWRKGSKDEGKTTVAKEA